MGSKETRSADHVSATPERFEQLTFFGKLRFIGKLIVFLASFGFIYPNILSD